MPMSTTERARIAALTRHSRGDTRDATAAARAGFAERFEREVDPDGVLPPAERAARAARARRAHMLRLAARSVESRRRKAAARAER
jgi:hypothetical protein